MTEAAHLDEAEAAQYERRVRESAAVEALLAEAAVDLTPDELERDSVYRSGESTVERPVIVRLHREGTESTTAGSAFLYEGFEGDVDTSVAVQATLVDGEVREAELTTGSHGGLLVGRGEVWTYRDGTVIDGTWIS
ncbi:hypothetical protein [Haloarchaeobius sp. DT45]|uniref:hypothetical protein n=1 Tax=Haloarchaeobius sp. DT45 TaxID=3446116 RepID=UPI003F6BBBC6